MYMDNNLQLERVRQSCIVLANASAVVANVVQNIAGNDIANTVNGESITRDMLMVLAQSQFKKSLQSK